MTKSSVLAVVAAITLFTFSTVAEAGGWYVSGYRAYSGPHVSYYRSRTVVNPPGPGFYSSRTVSVGYGSWHAPPVYATGPVYPAGYGYQFTPYYYPVAPVYAAPVYVSPAPVVYYGW